MAVILALVALTISEKDSLIVAVTRLNSTNSTKEGDVLSRVKLFV